MARTCSCRHSVESSRTTAGCQTQHECQLSCCKQALLTCLPQYNMIYGGAKFTSCVAGLCGMWLHTGERSCFNSWSRAVTNSVAENEAGHCQNHGRACLELHHVRVVGDCLGSQRDNAYICIFMAPDSGPLIAIYDNLLSYHRACHVRFL